MTNILLDGSNGLDFFGFEEDDDSESFPSWMDNLASKRVEPNLEEAITLVGVSLWRHRSWPCRRNK